MLTRLLLVLIAIFAAPSVAVPACHDMPVAMAGMAHHGPAPAEAPDRAVPGDMCIGCIAPSTLHPPRLAAPTARLTGHAIVPGPSGSARIGLPPATPPPRAG